MIKRVVEVLLVLLSVAFGALLLFIGLISALWGVENSLHFDPYDVLGILEGTVICLALVVIGGLGIWLPVSRIIRGRRERRRTGPR